MQSSSEEKSSHLDGNGLPEEVTDQPKRSATIDLGGKENKARIRAKILAGVSLSKVETLIFAAQEEEDENRIAAFDNLLSEKMRTYTLLMTLEIGHCGAMAKRTTSSTGLGNCNDREYVDKATVVYVKAARVYATALVSEFDDAGERMAKKAFKEAGFDRFIG